MDPNIQRTIAEQAEQDPKTAVLLIERLMGNGMIGEDEARALLNQHGLIPKSPFDSDIQADGQSDPMSDAIQNEPGEWYDWKPQPESAGLSDLGGQALLEASAGGVGVGGEEHAEQAAGLKAEPPTAFGVGQAIRGAGSAIKDGLTDPYDQGTGVMTQFNSTPGDIGPKIANSANRLWSGLKGDLLPPEDLMEVADPVQSGIPAPALAPSILDDVPALLGQEATTPAAAPAATPQHNPDDPTAETPGLGFSGVGEVADDPFMALDASTYEVARGDEKQGGNLLNNPGTVSTSGSGSLPATGTGSNPEAESGDDGGILGGLLGNLGIPDSGGQLGTALMIGLLGAARGEDIGDTLTGAMMGYMGKGRSNDKKEQQGLENDFKRMQMDNAQEAMELRRRTFNEESADRDWGRNKDMAELRAAGYTFDSGGNITGYSPGNGEMKKLADTQDALDALEKSLAKGEISRETYERTANAQGYKLDKTAAGLSISDFADANG